MAADGALIKTKTDTHPFPLRVAAHLSTHAPARSLPSRRATPREKSHRSISFLHTPSPPFFFSPPRPRARATVPCFSLRRRTPGCAHARPLFSTSASDVARASPSRRQRRRRRRRTTPVVVVVSAVAGACGKGKKNERRGRGGGLRARRFQCDWKGAPAAARALPPLSHKLTDLSPLFPITQPPAASAGDFAALAATRRAAAPPSSSRADSGGDDDDASSGAAAAGEAGHDDASLIGDRAASPAPPPSDDDEKAGSDGRGGDDEEDDSDGRGDDDAEAGNDGCGSGAALATTTADRPPPPPPPPPLANSRPRPPGRWPRATCW